MPTPSWPPEDMLGHCAGRLTVHHPEPARAAYCEQRWQHLTQKQWFEQSRSPERTQSGRHTPCRGSLEPANDCEGGNSADAILAATNQHVAKCNWTVGMLQWDRHAWWHSHTSVIERHGNQHARNSRSCGYVGVLYVVEGLACACLRLVAATTCCAAPAACIQRTAPCCCAHFNIII